METIFSKTRLACLVLLVASAAVAVPQIFMPGDPIPLSSSAPVPRRCGGRRTYCGDDGDYPTDRINFAVENNLSAVVYQRFFPNGRIEDYEVEAENAGYVPACGSKSEHLPRNAKAENINGRVRYLLQHHDRVQYYRATVCTNPGDTCRTHGDVPPHLPGTVTCRQLYTTAKLLAYDEFGEVTVDTFRLPSACVCHYSHLLSKRNAFPSFTDVSKMCSNSEVRLDSRLRERRHEVDEDYVYFPDHPGFTEGSSASSRLKAPEDECPDGVCDEDEVTEDATYPSLLIADAVVRNSLNTSFEGVFGAACGNRTGDVNSELGLRTGATNDETPLCRSVQTYVFPKRVRSVSGRYRYVVNTDSYKQGVSVVRCLRRSRGRGCTYGAERGSADTVCRQATSLHNMLAVDDNFQIYVETFRIPTACVCHISRSASPFS